MKISDIFTQPVLKDYILPWILVFVIIFAALEKSKILGEGKKQINAIVGAVCGLILLAFSASRNLIVSIIPFLVVVAIIIFVFMLLYGFVSGETKGDPFGKGIKITFGIVIFIALAIAILSITGKWDDFLDFISISNTGSTFIFILIAIGAVVAVLIGSGKKGD